MMAKFLLGIEFMETKKKKLDALKGFMRDTPISNKNLYWRLAYVIS